MKKKYYAAFNRYATWIEEGHDHTYDAVEFESKEDRDKFVELKSPDNRSVKPISRRQAYSGKYEDIILPADLGYDPKYPD